MKIAKPPFTMIAPQIKSPSDPSKGIAATVSGNAVTYQEISEYQTATPSTHPRPSRGGIHRTVKGNITGVPAGAVAQIAFDLAAAKYGIPFILFIGDWELASGHTLTLVDETSYVGSFRNSDNIDPAANALAIADMLTSLSNAITDLGFSCVTDAGAGTIDITAPIGLDYHSMEISYVLRGLASSDTPIVSITQFTGGSPTIGAMTIS